MPLPNKSASFRRYHGTDNYECLPAKNLKHRDGRLMGGDSLKNITLETKQEKEERIVKDKETDKKIKLFEIEKEKLEVQLEETESGREKLALKRSVDKVKKELKKLENGLSSGKFATLYESEELTLSKSFREIINKLTEGAKNQKNLARELVKRAKENKLEFYTQMAKNIQKYLPLDNRMLSKLVYIDPLKIEDKSTEDSFRFICKQLPTYISETEVDEVVSDLRILQVNLADMGELFTEYCKTRENSSSNECEIQRIDLVWSSVIKNPKYQFLSKFLRAVLSFIHSTTGAEGSIQDFRKIVGSYSRRTSDITCTARMSGLSATRSSSAVMTIMKM